MQSCNQGSSCFFEIQLAAASLACASDSSIDGFSLAQSIKRCKCSNDSMIASLNIAPSPIFTGLINKRGVIIGIGKSGRIGFIMKYSSQTHDGQTAHHTQYVPTQALRANLE